MGIDGVGKGGGVPPAPPAPTGAERVDGPGAAPRPFHAERALPVEDPHAAGHVGVPDAASLTKSPLARLRSGEVDVEGYLDLKVDEATASLASMPEADLAEIKRVLREQLATDPGLVDLVRNATGHVPNSPDDG